MAEDLAYRRPEDIPNPVAADVPVATATPRADFFRRVSWAAIFGGVLVALGMEVLFALFGLFVGFRLTPGGAATWSKIWYLVTSFFALFFGGWVAAKIAGNPNRGTALLHGFVTWGLTAVATFAIVATLAWGAVGGTIQMARAAVVAAGEAAPTVQATTPPAQQRQAERQAANAANQVEQNAPQIAHTAAMDASTVALFLWIGFLIAIPGSLLGAAAAGIPNLVLPRRV